MNFIILLICLLFSLFRYNIGGFNKVYFSGNNETKITFWHHIMYNDFLCDIWKSGWLDDRNAYIIVNFAFYFSLDVEEIRALKPFDCFGNSTSVISNILLMSNALDELPHMKKFCPQCQVLFHPNNCFLSGYRLRSADTPNIVNTSEPLCIIISKGHKLKRYELSLPIPNKFFITYDIQHGLEPLETYLPVKIYRDVHTSDVKRLLTQADFGAILSSMEGNCYASNEYLLSGLPVLSTYSKGGRDYFYDVNNSIICNGTLEGVKDGYLRMKQFILHNPNFDRYQIKKRVEEKVEGLRVGLVDKIFTWLDRSGNIPHNKTIDSSKKIIYTYLYQYNKGAGFMNFWLRKLYEKYVKVSILSSTQFTS